jgi:hypothetical protein
MINFNRFVGACFVFAVFISLVDVSMEASDPKNNINRIEILANYSLTANKATRTKNLSSDCIFTNITDPDTGRRELDECTLSSMTFIRDPNDTNKFSTPNPMEWLSLMECIPNQINDPYGYGKCQCFGESKPRVFFKNDPDYYCLFEVSENRRFSLNPFA